MALVVKNPPVNAGDLEMWIWSLGQEDPLEEGVATHSSILAWRIPRTAEPSGLQSIASQRAGWTRLKWLSACLKVKYWYNISKPQNTSCNFAPQSHSGSTCCWMVWYPENVLKGRTAEPTLPIPREPGEQQLSTQFSQPYFHLFSASPALCPSIIIWNTGLQCCLSLSQQH